MLPFSFPDELNRHLFFFMLYNSHCFASGAVLWNKNTPAGGVKMGNIKRWRIFKENNNLICAHGLMVGRLFAELSVFLFCGDDDGPGSVLPSRDGVILSPLCSSCWSFPLRADRWPSSHHSMMLHNRLQWSFRSSRLCASLSLWLTWPHTHKQHR